MANSNIGVEGRRSEDLASAAEELTGRFAEIDQRIKQFCRERPLTALVGSLAVGFVIGRLLSHK